jgi:type IV pilus assembly protein PilA
MTSRRTALPAESAESGEREDELLICKSSLWFMTPMSPQGGPPKSSSTTVLIIALAVAGASLLCCVGGLAVIAVPNFMKFNVKSKQSEVKFNLKAAYTAQRSYFIEEDTYAETIDEAGFYPERGNRYRYVFSARSDSLLPGSPDGGTHNGVLADPRHSPDNPALLAAIPRALLGEAGLHGKCPEACDFTVVAVGNIDGDADVDLWSISTKERTLGGELVPAGLAYQHLNDTR